MTERPDLRTLASDLLAADAAKIAGLMLAIYVTYILVGVILGYSPGGMVNTLRRLTFLVAIYSMVALALNLHWGYTGLFNIGVAGFMAVGLYTMAMLAKPAVPTGGAQYAGLGLPIPIAILGGVVAAALAGFVVALPALRLRADYFAIVTIAFAEIVRLLYTAAPFQEFTIFGYTTGTGGGRGLLFNFRDPMVGLYELPIFEGATAFVNRFIEFSPSQAQAVLYTAVLVVVLAAYYLLLKRTGESPFGRVLKAIREDEEATNALGKNTSAFKIKSFMLGCALMGLAGILWQFRRAGITPSAFRPHVTFYIWIALIIGGAGSNTGSILGAGIFTAGLFEGPQYLRRVIGSQISVGQPPGTFADAVGPMFALNFQPIVAYLFNNMLTLQFVFMGVVLVWLMQNRPEGLLGHRTETAAAVPLRRRSDETAEALAREETEEASDR
ncbi:branched-chain amino acid ABC transporter permease [Halorussus amylolyticus]|uniref:branched-chain amino acid ABC transporter permease n=1 Tax=Halorussus amylolyticus TaxID=1126242 RepID=UPI00105298D4|nr:branched-chain amino acid ABC transporter permease [Halorussus amylolyticus]